MVKSIAMVSEELGVSKASIYKKLKSEKYQSLIIMENGKMMIGEELLEMLKPKRSKKSKVETIKDVEIVEQKEIEIIEENKDSKDKVLDILMEQLNGKDIQISRLHDLVEKNQIIINRKEQNEEERLKLEEHFKSIDERLADIRDNKENKRKVKNSLKKFFHSIYKK